MSQSDEDEALYLRMNIYEGLTWKILSDDPEKGYEN
jgi:hypothetical protein